MAVQDSACHSLSTVHMFSDSHTVTLCYEYSRKEEGEQICCSLLRLRGKES